LHLVPNMHYVIGFDKILVNIRGHFTPSKPLHDEHLLAQIVEVSNKYLKY
jgi:hypothetical protein